MKNTTYSEPGQPGTYVPKVEASSQSLTPGAYYHFHVYNTSGGGYDVNEQEFRATSAYHTFTVFPGRNFPSGSLMCVDGYEQQASGYFRLLGRPCVTIR